MTRLKPVVDWLRTVIVVLQSHLGWNYRRIGLNDDTLRPELDAIVADAGLQGRVELCRMMKGAQLLEQ